LKGGADSPENFLAYADFDDTYDASADSGSYKDVGTFIHKYEAHLRDWKAGDPTWKNGKGKGIIGALNYLASEGANSVYFLTYNLDGGDGRDTWMWTTSKVRDRFDCSKLDQWEIVFSHMDHLGIMLHFVTQETENDRNLGGSAGLNPIRKLYYRELIARFSHHLAVIWNLGEENNTPDKDRKEIAAYIRAVDPYDHPITVHTHNNKSPEFYKGILGDPGFEASSIQSGLDRYHGDAVNLRRLSAEAGRKWAIFGDEQAPASHGVVPDANDPDHDGPRKLALWGNLMGGGSGVEWYFGHRFKHMDINCEDWRSRDRMWDLTRYALEFFRWHLPFTEMGPHDEFTSAEDDYCFAKPGEIYAIYLPAGGTTNLDLGGSSARFTVQWYNPRNAGPLQTGTKTETAGPGQAPIGDPPNDDDKDWIALVKLKYPHPKTLQK
ncbi:MAG: putative collagen-binding domain-containing protein, partial [Planctomycetota bacterium]